MKTIFRAAILLAASFSIWAEALAADLKIDWMYVQVRSYEDGTRQNVLSFGLKDASGAYVTKDILTSITAYDNDGNPLTLSNLTFSAYNSLYGSYNSNSSRWEIGNTFSLDSDYTANIAEELKQGTYRLVVMDSDNVKHEATSYFKKSVGLPVIPSSSFRVVDNYSENGALWKWDIPTDIDPNLDTSARAIINIYKQGNYVGLINVKIPAHMGNLFISDTMWNALSSKGDSLGFIVQLRTNDNSYRTYSKSIPLAYAIPKLLVDFGSYGIYSYDILFDNSQFKWVMGGNPKDIRCWGNRIVANYEPAGIYMYDGNSWSYLGGSPEGMEVWGKYLAVDYGEYGLYLHNGDSWNYIAGNPENMKVWANKLVVDFGTSGLYVYDGSSWVSLSAGDAEKIIVGE